MHVSQRDSRYSVLRFLSMFGREVSFPKEGILAQAAEARRARIDATIGIALCDDRSPLGLPSLEALLGVPSKEALPYASSHGQLPLRKLWSDLVHRKNPSLHTTVSVPVITSGLTQGLSIAAELFLDPGDALVLVEPYWENYDLIFRRVTETPLRTVPLFHGDSFNFLGVQSALSGGSQKIVLLLNFPNNPTGYALREEEAVGLFHVLCDMAEKGRELVVIVDDAYFGLVYEDGIFRESLFAPLASLHENILAVKVDGCSKEDYAWGLRVGFLTYGGKGLAEHDFRLLEDKTAAVIRGTLSNVSHLSQSLVLRTLQSPTYWEERAANAAVLERRFRAAWTAANHAASDGRFRVLPCNAGYFLCLELSDGLRAEDVRRRLLAEHSIGVITVGERLLRVAFSAIPEADIPDVFRCIAQVCSSFPVSV